MDNKQRSGIALIDAYVTSCEFDLIYKGMNVLLVPPQEKILGCLSKTLPSMSYIPKFLNILNKSDKLKSR